MSYRFGREIATFHLTVRQPGAHCTPDWSDTQTFVDPETLKVLPEDDCDAHIGPFEPVSQSCAVLKTVWHVSLSYDSSGAIGHEHSGGCWLGEWFPEWAEQAARIFAGRRPVPLRGVQANVLQLDDLSFTVDQDMDEPHDSFPALFTSEWSGYGEDAELDIEFEGELDMDSLRVVSRSDTSKRAAVCA